MERYPNRKDKWHESATWIDYAAIQIAAGLVVMSPRQGFMDKVVKMFFYRCQELEKEFFIHCSAFQV